ncbi:MAG TPA: hypothetical protein VJT49_24175 [Amycolatopsis sp.]|uniref:hypothetical protein n=1 Tax=Amycolatopsis sp. TaxID=37632 RepID=UPI002B475598|nr:hypothetical protein [Amycolatopsis sp.]HKS48149.1 hypothetical protein [Amycolatopsis sp.]
MAISVAEQDDEIVERELPRHWVRPGERLLFGCAPIRGYVRARIGSETRLPHEPIGKVPALDSGPCRWPLPADGVGDEDWADDPTVAFFVLAQHASQHAVAFGDHFAHSRGEARLALTNRRAAVIYTTKLFHPPGPGEPLFMTFSELDIGRVRGYSAPYVGRSIPPEQVIRVDFADGSSLLLRDPLANLRVVRATTRQ